MTISTALLRRTSPGNGFGAMATISAIIPKLDVTKLKSRCWLIEPASAGGCNFAVRPSFSATETTIYWAPEADPGTVILTAAPSLADLDAAAPRDLDQTTARPGIDGLSIVHGHGAAAVRLLLLGDIPSDHPLAALVPLGADGLDHIEAVTRLWRAINNRAVPPDARLTAQQRRRQRHMLQAVDGRMSGASYREIADAIFGAARVADDPWKTSPLRDATIDLVKDGLSLIAGGYRRLLRRRRR